MKSIRGVLKNGCDKHFSHIKVRRIVYEKVTLTGMVIDFHYWKYIFYIMMGAIICTFYVTKLFNFLKTKSNNDSLFSILLSNLKAPIVLIILILSSYHSVEVLLHTSESSVLHFVKQIFPVVYDIKNVTIIVVVAWYLLRVTSDAQKYFAKRSTAANVYIVSKIMQVLVIFSAALLIIDKLGLNINGIITFGGIGGIAAGLAAKDLLSNFFGSLVITLDKPFVRGDKILIPEKNLSGFVTEIGWRLTKVITYEKRPIYIPNALFATAIVQNDSRMSHRRINDRWRVAYNDIALINKIIDGVDNMMRHNMEIDQMQTILVSLDSIGSKIFTFNVYAFTKSTDWCNYKKVREDIMIEIANIVSECGAILIFPEAQVEVRDGRIENYTKS